MPRTSARLSSARLNNGRSATKENQIVEANTDTASGSQAQPAAQALRPIQPTAPRGRKRVNVPAGSRTLQGHRQDPSGTSSTSINQPLGVLNRDTGGSPGLIPQESNAHPTPRNSPESNGNSESPDTNVHDELGELQQIREERDRLLAEVQSLRVQYDTSRPNQPTTEPALISRPEGRRIQLQEDMGLANDRIRFLSIRRTMKDVLNRAGLDYMVCWEHQPKDKLAKIFHVVKDRQPYLKRFAHNWPIEEYIKRHHKHVRAYHRRLANDGTNVTIPNVSSDEISDSQGEVPSDPDMYLDDL